MGLAVAKQQNCIGVGLLAVQPQLLDAALRAGLVFNGQLIGIAAELAGHCDLLPVCRDTWINGKAVIPGMKAQHILRDGAEHPAGGAGYPGEQRFALAGIIRTEIHVGDHIRFAAGMGRRVGCRVG